MKDLTIEEVKQICHKVLADRKNSYTVDVPIYSPLKFTNPRYITDPSLLDEKEIRQLIAAGQDGVGMQLLPEDLLREGEEEGFYKPELWDVIDSKDELAFRVFMYGVDNGTVLKGDTTQIVAGCSQGGVEGVPAVVEALKAAKARMIPGEFSNEFCIRFFGRF
jgi:hypothetical protein